MALADLTDAGSVLQAVREFDTLGREAFLTKYGFGRSRSYFLVAGGKHYDSKAIAGVSHGYQYPALGPLKRADFSGGDAIRDPQPLDATIAVCAHDEAVRRFRGGMHLLRFNDAPHFAGARHSAIIGDVRP